MTKPNSGGSPISNPVTEGERRSTGQLGAEDRPKTWLTDPFCKPYFRLKAKIRNAIFALEQGLTGEAERILREAEREG